MKHEDLLGQNAQLHNKLYQMLRDRILRIMETALIYGEIGGYFPEVFSITRDVKLEKGEEIVVNFTYQEDGNVTMTAHIPDGKTVWSYVWAGGLVNIVLVEDAIKILEALEKQDVREGYLDKRDAYVQTLERAFQKLGGVLTRKMRASDYVEMRKQEGSQ